MKGVELPSELAAQWEDGTWLGSCDLGDCSNEQEGWALCEVPGHGAGDPEWLASCRKCGTATGPLTEDQPPPMRYIPFPLPANERKHYDECRASIVAARTADLKGGDGMSGVEQFVCSDCGWRCKRRGCSIPPADHECMWCGADGPTFWNGEPADCRRVVVIVADAEFPHYWARKYIGQERHAVEINYGGRTFYIDNENGSGWAKVRFAGGGPGAGHSSLRIERVIQHTSPPQDTDT